MSSLVPDEILKEILSPVLQIPDQSFASFEGRSPFSMNQKSTSVYLLVCKDWLRVATPLLYNVVILRSKAQIRALVLALKSIPELGCFIKKLRIECSYNNSLLQVFREANGLTDLCLSLEIYSQDDVSGICKGMTLIQPRRVIIYDPFKGTRRGFSQKGVQLAESLIGLIPTWTNLTTFILPRWRYGDRDFYERLGQALCKSPSLQEIGGLDEYCSLFLEFAKIPTIRRILVCRTFIDPEFVMGHGLPEAPKIVEKYPKLAGLVAYEEHDNGGDSGVASPAGLPSDWCKKFPTPVLEKIFLYVKGIDILQDFAWESKRLIWIDELPYPQGPALVCKEFYEIYRNLDWQYVAIQFKGSLSRLAQDYKAQPELGNLAKCLWIYPFYKESLDEAHDLEFVISCCPNLQQFGFFNSVWTGLDQYSFSWETISALVTRCGHKLLDLQINLHKCDSVHDPRSLLGFTNLRSLCWSSDAMITLDHAKLPKSAFCNLESLACAAGNDTFLRLMAALNLPRVHSARFPDCEERPGVSLFLEKHGPKLQRLQTTFPLSINVFETCPNLKLFSVPDGGLGFLLRNSQYPTGSIISCSWDHPLEEMSVGTFAYGSRNIKAFRFLGDLDLSSFPRLRHIEFADCDPWPFTEYEIRKSPWVVWAERLQNLYGVDIIDLEGMAWVPRLR